MTDLTYKFSGVNTRQLEREVQHLRQNSITFRALEAAAAAAGYTTIELQMGAGLLPGEIADSTRVNSTTRKIRMNSDASASWGVRGRQATVGEVIAHELAHAVVPPEHRRPRVYDLLERDSEGMWVRQQAGQVARDLGLRGPNNADYPATRIPINEIQGCTFEHPRGDGPRDGVLFFDGTRGYNGIGSTVSPDTGSQDPANSRRLATDKQGEPQAGSNDERTSSPPLRYLRRLVGTSDASVFDTGVPGLVASPPISASLGPYPDVSSSPSAGWARGDHGDFGLLGDKAGKSFGGGIGIGNLQRKNPSQLQSAGPPGLITGQPMPNYPVQPPVFGLPDRSSASSDDATDWFSRWIKSFLQQ